MNFKNKKVAFFDMDGTLVDSETLYYEARRDVFAKYGFDYPKSLNDTILGTGFARTIQLLQEVAGDDELGKKINDESLELFNQRVEEGKLAVKPGAEELLKFLREQGIKSYITSSSDIDKIHFNLQHNDLQKYFTDIISGEDVKNNKPAPDIYLHALKKANVQKEDAVVFEDAISGVQSALNAGINVIAVPDQVAFPEELTGQIAVVDSLDQAIELFE